MEVVSSSNLVSSETEKSQNSLYFSAWLCHEKPNMNMKQKIYKIYKYEAIRNFMIAAMWKSTLGNTYTQNSKIKTYRKS